MMNQPPSYDDESEIPRKRLILLIDQFEGELHTIQRVFKEHFPKEVHAQKGIEDIFWALRNSADQLGSKCSNSVESLIHKYEIFKTKPSEEALNALFYDLENLKTLLMTR